MPTTTYNTYSEVDTHSFAAGSNSSYNQGVAGGVNGGTPDEFYGAVTGTGSSAAIVPFTRSNYAVDNNGVQIYLFTPSYGSKVLASNNNEDIAMVMGPASLTTNAYPQDELWIRVDCMVNSILPSGWANASSSVAGSEIKFYLKLFDTTPNGVTTEHNVCLEYSGGSRTLGSKSYYTTDFVTPAEESADGLCLTDTCDILTPNGNVNVKDLSVGDLVTTPEGKNVKITKVMKPTTHVAMGKNLPHFIPKNSLGENKPSKDTFVSKNHAYKSGDGWLCGQFNIEHNAINWDKDFVTYYNIMTEDYPKHTLVVNGVEMESWGGYQHNKPETHGNIKLRREKLGFK